MLETLENFEILPDLHVEAWVLNMKKVSLSARILYSLLAALSRKHGYAWPTQRFLAKRLGVSLRTINSLIGELKQAGKLKVDSPTQTRSTCLYTPKQLTPARPHQAEATPNPHCAGVRKGGTQGLRTTVNKGKSGVREKNPLNPPQGEGRPRLSPVNFRLEEFNTCYTAWPLQQNRKAALRTWKRLAQKGELPIPGKILATIEDFKNRDAYWKRKRIPALNRWLSNHRWEDQPHIISPDSPPYPVPVSSGSPSRDLETQARGQLVMLRNAITTGNPDKKINSTTQLIMSGHGGLHGLRTLHQREIGFVLSSFVKDYVALSAVLAGGEKSTPEKSNSGETRNDDPFTGNILGAKKWPEVSASTLQRTCDIANGCFTYSGDNNA